MKNKNIVWDDLKFFLEVLKLLPVSRTLSLGNNNFCVSTGCSFESWVCYPDSITSSEDVDSVIKFFGEQNLYFMWPLHVDDQYSCKILEASGLVYAGSLRGMTIEPDKKIADKVNPAVNFKHVTTPELARRWAETAWRGFDMGGCEVSENYYALINAFMNDKNLSLYIAELDNKPAGTFAITNKESVTGVYYFSTLPELRRKGVAASMMNEICRLSGEKILTLQATPAGVPFYKSFGFEDLFEIKVYSTEPDIF